MLRSRFVFGLSFLLLTPLALRADEFSASKWELTLGGTISANNNVDAGGLGVGAGVGYFLTRDFELSLRETVYYTSFPHGTNFLSTTNIAGDYHFDLGKFRPFIGAHVGYGQGLHATSSFEAGPEIGVKYFLKPDIFLYGMAQYDQFFRNRSLKGGIRNSEFILSFGIGFRL